MSLPREKKAECWKRQASYLCFEHSCQKGSAPSLPLELKATGLMPVHKENDGDKKNIQSPQDKYGWFPFWSKRDLLIDSQWDVVAIKNPLLQIEP